MGAVGTEVRWSCKKTRAGTTKVSYYIHCGLCNAQVFYNTWNEAWGYTLPEAEAMGLTLIKLDSARKDELLRALGLERVPGPPRGMFPPMPPPMPPPHYRPGPAPRRPGKSKKKN
jgi:hypothetical protein